jgi:hypothetical protein
MPPPLAPSLPSPAATLAPASTPTPTLLAPPPAPAAPTPAAAATPTLAMPAPTMPHTTASQRAAAFVADHPIALPTLPSAADVQKETAPAGVAAILAPGVNEVAANAAANARAALDAARKRGQRKIRLATAVAVVLLIAFTAFGVWAWPKGGGDEATAEATATTVTADATNETADVAVDENGIPLGPFTPPTPATVKSIVDLVDDDGRDVTVELTTDLATNESRGTIVEAGVFTEFISSPERYFWRPDNTAAFSPPDSEHLWIRPQQQVWTIDQYLPPAVRPHVELVGSAPSGSLTMWDVTVDLDAVRADLAESAVELPFLGTDAAEVALQIWVDDEGVVQHHRASLSTGEVEDIRYDFFDLAPPPIEWPASDFDFQAYLAAHPE